MAVIIPELNSCLSRMTNGEKRFARRLSEKLEDDYLCWYDVPVGKKTLYPDFIILHPRRGILILEVKDWKLETIKHVTHATVTLLTLSGPVEKSNPFRQARNYAHTVVNLLKNDPALTEQQGEYAGNLLFPWGYGVVLANITRKAFESTNLGEVFQPDRILCKDEMTESADTERFQEQLWGMFVYSFGHALTMPQIDRIRWHIFPEVRIDVQMSLFPDTVSEQTPEVLDPRVPGTPYLIQSFFPNSLVLSHFYVREMN